MASILETGYETLQSESARDMKGPKVDVALRGLIGRSLKFLAESCEIIPLSSLVPGKKYMCFHVKRKPGKFTRPVNAELFDAPTTIQELPRLVSGNIGDLDPITRAKVLYTGAISYCAANDLIKKDDRKTPGTFFERFVGHLVASKLAANPTNAIEVLNLDLKSDLPTDFIFDLGEGKNRIHLPIKISTRERVVQVWAHQRVLDGVYGMNRFKGVLVCLAETNMVRKNMSVLEVCLPDQWALYQMFIAQLHRIYYFDPPAKYLPLAHKYPFIHVKHFSAFFDEYEQLATSSPLA